MAHHPSRRLVASAAVAVLGIVGIGVRHSGSLSPRHSEPPAVDQVDRAEEPTDLLAPVPSEPQQSSPSRETSATIVAPRAKGQALNRLLEQRPPALADPQAELRSDPERQRRYAERAGRAKRLNQRLIQRIEELEARLTSSKGSEQSAIQVELSQLRANLAQRQNLERAAIPAEGTRSGS
jgi:hypothetical protein